MNYQKNSLTEEHSLLKSWCRWAAKRIFSVDDGQFLCFGNGHNHWGVQTVQKAVAAFASATDAEETPQWRDYALRLLRFNLATHITGTRRLLDGTHWGNTWISVLGIERMLHVLPLMESCMTAEDHAFLRRVLLSEAGWILDHFKPRGDKVHPNIPESCLWNGSFLYRIAHMYPDEPQRDCMLEQSHALILNGISKDADATDASVVAGRKISQWHNGSHFFDTMALHHHGYLNVGYMYICLSQVAILHFTCKQAGWPIPESLYHNARQLWEVLRKLTLPDGRLARIGGDTRVRYAYCQDYAPVVWLLAADKFNDPQAATLPSLWLSTIQKEAASNGDGSFFGTRLTQLSRASWLYHARLETDRAVSLSMSLAWNPVPAIRLPKRASSPEAEDDWHDPYHGAVLVRGKRRFASWTWLAAYPNQGLCFPVQCSDMAEWKQNIGAEIIGRGARNIQKAIEFKTHQFPGGFLTFGLSDHCSEFFCSEGETSPVAMARQFTAAAALPDDKTMLVIQRCTSLITDSIRSFKGLFLQIPNDLFNDFHRKYRCEDGTFKSTGGDSGKRRVMTVKGNWTNIDDQLGVILGWGPTALQVHQPGCRQIGLKAYPHIDDRPAGGNLCCDEICTPLRMQGVNIEQDKRLFDVGFAILAGSSAEDTRRVSKTQLSADCSPGSLPLLQYITDKGRHFVLVSNPTDEKAKWRAPEHIRGCWGGSLTEDPIEIILDPFAASLCELSG